MDWYYGLIAAVTLCIVYLYLMLILRAYFREKTIFTITLYELIKERNANGKEKRKEV